MECATCGRKLKDKKSIDRGYGPACYQKHLKAMEELEKIQVTIDEVIEGDAVCITKKLIN